MPSQHTDPPATDGHTPTDVWTEQRIRALGALTDLPTAGKIFGLGRATSYELARTGRFPTPLIRVGTRYRVPVAAILTILGLPANDMAHQDLTPTGESRIDHHQRISSPHPPHQPDIHQGAS